MLDLFVCKGSGFGRTKQLDISIFTNPTYLGAPLHYSSVHPWSVHASWPYGRLYHFKKLCSDRGSFNVASVQFMKRFREFFQSPKVCQRLLELHFELQHDFARTPLRAADRPINTWLVLPFSPTLANRELLQCLKTILQDFADFGFATFQPKLSWKRSFRNLRELCAGMIVNSA